jgi:hypothetical protein
MATAMNELKRHAAAARGEREPELDDDGRPMVMEG